MIHLRVLVVEDHVKMADLISRSLRDQGYAVDAVNAGEDALWSLQSSDYDAVVLDLVLPGIDGFEVCQRMRQEGIWVPVLMLTARDSVDDRVRGLDMGGDDYLIKPFALAELGARIRALVRRVTVSRPTVLTVGDLTLDPARHEVSRGSTQVHLTAKEFALLEYFMRHEGDVLSRTTLIDHVWDFAYHNDSNVVDVYVRYLREKVDRPFGRDSLETVRGRGYRIRDESLTHGPASEKARP